MCTLVEMYILFVWKPDPQDFIYHHVMSELKCTCLKTLLYFFRKARKFQPSCHQNVSFLLNGHVAENYAKNSKYCHHMSSLLINVSEVKGTLISKFSLKILYYFYIYKKVLILSHLEFCSIQYTFITFVLFFLFQLELC